MSADLPSWAGNLPSVALGLVIVLSILWLGRLIERANRSRASFSSAGRGQERRGSIRRPVKLTPVLLAESIQSRAAPRSAQVFDRSTGGLGLEVDAPVRAGTQLDVRAAKSDSLPWITVEVRYCQPTQHKYHIGCKFIDQPSDKVMASFG